jgi:hypothetical protein
MDVRPSRLRRGESIAGAGALLLTVSLFALSWYKPQASAGSTAASLNGWHGLTHLRWLVLVTIIVALALVWLQVSRRAPALPVTCSLFTMLLGGVSVLALLFRVIIDPPGGMSVSAGAYLGVLAAVLITYGGYKSMRTEGIAAGDAPAQIETVRLEG